MTRRMLAAAGLGAIALLVVTPAESWALGGKRKKAADCGGCEATPVVAHAGDCGGCGPAPCGDHVVVTYKPVWKCKKVEVDCVEYKWVDEPYKYKVCKIVETKVPCKYTTYEWQKVKDTVKVCKTEWKERTEPCTTYVPEHHKVTVKKVVCDTVCVPTEVPAGGGKKKGLFGRLCGKKDDCADPCGTVVVLKPTVVRREVECEEVVCKWVPKPGTRVVKYCETTWVDQEVWVSKCVPVVHDGFKTVCTPTWVDCDGVRKVCKPHHVKKWVDQPYCEMVKCETVVPCGGCGPVPVAADCGSGGKKRGGLFARLCGK